VQSIVLIPDAQANSLRCDLGPRRTETSLGGPSWLAARLKRSLMQHISWHRSSLHYQATLSHIANSTLSNARTPPARKDPSLSISFVERVTDESGRWPGWISGLAYDIWPRLTAYSSFFLFCPWTRSMGATRRSKSDAIPSKLKLQSGQSSWTGCRPRYNDTRAGSMEQYMPWA